MSRRRTCSSMNQVLCDSIAVSGESFLGSWIVPKRAMVHDLARAALPHEKCPDPLDEYANSQIGCREKLNVDSGPGQPREGAPASRVIDSKSLRAQYDNPLGLEQEQRHRREEKTE